MDETGMTTEATSGGFLTDFFEAARSRVSSVLAPATQPSGGGNIGGQLFEAIYQFGRGKLDAAREKAVGAFLMTSEGQKVQREGIRQTATQYWPYIAVAAVLLVFAGVALRR